MSVAIIEDKDQENAVLYCNTTDWAFGPVFSEGDAYEDWPDSWKLKTAGEVAEAFLKWNGQRDVRTMTDSELALKVSAFIAGVSHEFVTESEE